MLMGGILSSLLAQEGTLTGTITDKDGKPIPSASVFLGLNEFKTDVLGAFIITKITFGSGEIIVSAEGYANQVIKFEINETEKKLENIILENKSGDDNFKDAINEASLVTLDMDDDTKQQSVGGLLNSRSDIFVSTAGYTFSAAYFRMRGYDGEFSDVMINGLLMNNGENGRASYSQWGGLNDAFRIKESTYGLTPAQFGFGGLNGTTNIDIRPSSQREQTKVSYAIANKTYRNRIMFSHSTGLMANGWAYTISGSRRWSETGYVEGTPYDAWSYFASAEKKINDKHSLSISVFGAPTKKGMQSASVQEAYDLRNSNYYNSNWGYQEGEVRNSKIRNTHEPIILLTHYFNINEKTKVNTTAGYTFGRNGTTALNWYNANDPRADYYRYLPSYHTETPSVANIYTSLWQNDANTYQINWNNLYQTNYYANSLGEQAKYIVEERRNDQRQFSIASYLNHQLKENAIVSGGYNVRFYKGKFFKTINDLLGGEYWKDVDQFAERDFDNDTIANQNDLNNPNRIVKENDKFGYDYIANVNTQNVWGLYELKQKNIDFYAGLSLTTLQYWRTGNMKNGRYPDNSYGDSEKQTFFNYAIKGGVTYKINGRNFVVGNFASMTEAPTFKNSYISPRTRDEVIPNITSRKIFSSDLNYIVRYPNIQGRLTLYKTNINDDSEINNYYNDEYKTYVNSVMTGINKVHQGMELGVEVKTLKSLFLSAVFAKGDFRYTSRPDYYVSADNQSFPDYKDIVYMKNFYINGTPQTAASFGIKYQGPKYLWININANYFDDIYIDFSPFQRTIGAIENFYNDIDKAKQVTEQKKAPGQFTLDLSISKSWRLYSKYNLNLNLNVNNIFDNQKLVTSGYEQLRYIDTDINKFPPKYYYGFGRTYFLSLGIKF